jgi:peptidoglycan/LPS O-acetylase OafA/YrhL
MGKLQRSDHLPTLDGWRAIAIIGVLISHGTARVLGPSGAFASPGLFQLTRYGVLGVDLFFGISGFLICTRLVQEEHQRGRISLKDFYVRRAFRIFPPYLLYLAILGLMAAAGMLVVRRWEWLSCALFFRNYLPLDLGNLGGQYTAHFWSLAVEEHFYLLWPGVLFLFGSRRSQRLVIAVVLVLAAWRAIEFRYGLVARHLVPGVGFYTRTDIRIDALLWGCWLALLFQDPIWRERFRRSLSPGLWLGLVALYVVCVTYVPPFALLWQSILIPLILLGTVLRPQSWVGRFLETSPMRWVGRISYGLYLWQQLFLMGKEVHGRLPLGFVQTFPVNVVVVFLCASLSYYLMERRLIRIGHALTSRRVPSSEQTVDSGVQPAFANTAHA